MSIMWRNLTTPLLLRCLLGVTIGAVLWNLLPANLTQRLPFHIGSVGQGTEQIRLPPNIEKETLRRFDSLVQEEKIFFEDTKPEKFIDHGFEFEFRIVSMFKQKPVLSPDAPGRSKASGPFISPDPDEVIMDLMDKHRLLVNKFCLYRPMLIVATKQYELQSDDLNVQDVNAVWSVLKAFSLPMLMIYNCGVNAGSSQGHKHTQLFPLPNHQLWPSQATDSNEVVTNIMNVPFKHFVFRITSNDSVDDIYSKYKRLLALAQQALIAAESPSRDYNVAMTADWIALIPRRTAGPNGPFGANAQGMLGMVSVKSQEERQEWGRLGYSEYLRELGVSF